MYKVYVEVFYRFYKLIFNYPKIHSIDDTLDFIINSNISVSRFGDGELHMIDNFGDIGFQKSNMRLSEKLKHVLIHEKKECIVCLPYPLYSIDLFTLTPRFFWKASVVQHYKRYRKYLEFDKNYHNSFITRPYMDFVDKSKVGDYFEKFKKLWESKNILIVEGELTKLGIGNDLFANSSKIERIITLNKNVFDLYDKLFAEIKSRIEDYDLILVALGPTASVLAYELASFNKQVIDIGHLDVEYVWYQNNNLKKVPIDGKFVNEADDKYFEVASNNGGNDEIVYQNQIIKKILQ